MDMKTNQLKNVVDLLEEAQKLLSSGITNGKISAIERDLVLEKLRKAYDSMVFEHEVEKPQDITPPVYQ